MIDDVCAPRSRLGDLIEGVERIAGKHRLTIGVVAHAGDGNTHPIVVYQPGDQDAERRAREAFADIMERAIALGGTITGEHGVGRAKKDALPSQLGPDVMALSHRIKDALDPDGILNPGAIL
jgi:glycolate oxidase